MNLWLRILFTVMIVSMACMFPLLMLGYMLPGAVFGVFCFGSMILVLLTLVWEFTK